MMDLQENFSVKKITLKQERFRGNKETNILETKRNINNNYKIKKMAKMTAIYKIPTNIESFDKHYFEIHIPLAKQLPGLIKYEISDGIIISTTGHESYRVAHLYFDSLD